MIASARHALHPIENQFCQGVSCCNPNNEIKKFMLPVLFGKGNLRYGNCPGFLFVFTFKNEVLVILPVMEDEKFVLASSLAFPSSKPVSPFITFVFRRLGYRSSREVKATKPAQPVLGHV